MNFDTELKGHGLRLLIVLIILGIIICGLIGRLIYLNVLNRNFLVKQSQARILRKIEMTSYRGIITDRSGMPLAISAPVESIWFNPKTFSPTKQKLQQLSKLLKLSPSYILHLQKKESKREFIYLKRRLPPIVANQIKALAIPGIFMQREYKRFYPEGEVAAHVLGLTNVDDHGQEGLELAYDKWLHGHSGVREVLKDRLGNVVADVSLLKKPEQGQNLILSLDHRIQYLAYGILKEAITQNKATAGSAIVLNVKTGEILALVNQPSYNPNQLSKNESDSYRNRAMTDSFEPGSVIKPFNIALALESGKYRPESKIDVSPGWLEIGGYKIKDEENLGVIDLTHILQKSSTIGAAKIMLSLKPQQYWDLLQRFGFGERTTSGFPGESNGTLVPRSVWYPSVVATLAYGYGIAVTPIQLAQAYAVLANGGVKVPITFLKQNSLPLPQDTASVIAPDVAKTVLAMLETVVQPGGTGTRAQIDGYRVAGKTGTAYMANSNGYDRHKYMSSFVGIAPVSDPQLVVAVVINNPKGDHLGGKVAAPIFAKIMGGALRILDIAPDAQT